MLSLIHVFQIPLSDTLKHIYILFHIGDALQGLVFVRLQLSCNSHIEFPYYSANNTRKDMCCHCAAEGSGTYENIPSGFASVCTVPCSWQRNPKEKPNKEFIDYLIHISLKCFIIKKKRIWFLLFVPLICCI